MSAIRQIGDWRQMRSILARRSKGFDRIINKALRQEGQFLRKKIVQGIRKQAPGGRKLRKLEPTTIATRRFRGFKGRKALIRTGGQGLLGAIQVIQKRGFVFIGVLRTKTTPGGQSLVDVARVHEFGSPTIVIPMTDKMRRFLFAMFAASGLKQTGAAGQPGVVVIRVPARPFLAPVFKKEAAAGKLRPRMLRRIAILTKGDFGKPG